MFRVKRVLLSVVLAAVLIVPAFIFFGCTPEQETGKYYIIDDIGQKVYFDKAPERVVINGPAITELIFEMGKGDTVVAVSNSDTYPEEVADIEQLGFGSKFSGEAMVEKMIELDCEVLFMSIMNKDEDEGKKLKEANIKMVVFEAVNLEGMYSIMERLGVIYEDGDRAAELIDDVKRELSAVTEAVKDVSPVTAYFEIGIWEGTLYSVNGTSYIGEIMELCRIENVFKNEILAWLQLSSEQIVSADPYCIISSGGAYLTAADIKGRTGWGGIDAVENDRIYFVDEDQSNRTTSRVVLFAKDMVWQVYGIAV